MNVIRSCGVREVDSSPIDAKIAWGLHQPELKKIDDFDPKKISSFFSSDFLGPPKYQGLFEKISERTLAYTIT